MISVRDLNFSYSRNRKKHRVFDQLSLDFAKGFNVILGPNGAGKSTLIKSIFGLLQYDGNIMYGQESVTAMKTHEKIKLMSYLPQMDLDVSSLTVLEMVILGRLPELSHKISDEDLDIVMNTLKALNMDSFATRNFCQLSGGEKKLVFIAQTLVRNPKLMLLDEPVNSLDLQKQLELCQLLQRIVKDQDMDIIVVLHDINLAARYAAHIAVMDSQGGLYSSGSPKEVVTAKMLKDVYGVIGKVSHDEMGIPLVAAISSVRGA